MTLDGFTFPDFVRRCFRCGDPIDDHAWGFFVNARKPDRFEVLCSSCEPKQRDSWPGGAPFSKTFYAETYGRLTINDRRLWLASRFDAILRLLPLVSKQHVLDLTAWSGETADVRVQDVARGDRPASMLMDRLFISLHDASAEVKRFWRSYGAPLPSEYVWDHRGVSHFDTRRILTLVLEARLRRADTQYHYPTYERRMHIVHVAEQAWYVWIDRAIWEY